MRKRCTPSIPFVSQFYRAEEHLVHTQRIGTVFLDNHVGIYDVEHRFRHLFNRPTADILAVFEDKLGGIVFRTPVLEGFHVEHVVRHDVHIHVEWGSVVLVFQAQRHEGIGILDAIYEIASSLNHTLVHQLLERFFHNGDTQVVQELVPEAGVDQVAGSMFCTTYIEIHVLPVGIYVRGYQCCVVTRIHVAQVVGAGACEARHGVQFEREDGLVVYLAVLNDTVVYRVPSPLRGMSQWRFACFGRQELGHFGQLQRQAAFGNHVGHVALIVNGERFAPVALAAEDGVAQAVVHLDAAQMVFLDVFLGGGNGFLDGESVQ